MNFDPILKAIGAVLNAIYSVIPSYGLAIILLTILVRIILFPLAVKQIRSMTAMQRIQPKLKELQQKHKGDRQKLNEEMMKLYREHGVNPLGGCLPMLLQLPVFIALYAVIRASLVFDVAMQPATLEIPVTKDTICRPAEGPERGTAVVCETNGGESQRLTIASGENVVKQRHSNVSRDALPASVVRCTLPSDAKKGDQIQIIQCHSPLGTGHLPSDGKLTEAIVEDKSTFGMHLACSPTQASSKAGIRQCTVTKDSAGGPALIGYYGLVLLMVGTTYYQQRQMLSKQQGSPQAQQMQMMMKIMPVFMGFLSLNFPAALSLYWVVGNFWMIGQQHFTLKHQEGPTAGSAGNGKSGGAAGRPEKKPPQPGPHRPKKKKPAGKSKRRR